MAHRVILLTALAAFVPAMVMAAVGAARRPALRPPAVPLVVHDPYFSIWSFGDELAKDWPRHWTGAIHALCGMARIDGKAYRYMGMELKDLPAMKQLGLQVLPTRTIYEFEAGGVQLQLTFTTPALPHDLDVLARPVTYLTWVVKSTDGREHDVALYYDNSAELVVNTPEQPVVWSRVKLPGLQVMRMGSQEQPVLAKDGDNLRIDWGYLYVGVPESQGASTAIVSHDVARRGFAQTGRLPGKDDTRAPRPARDDWPVAACVFGLGKVGVNPASRHLMLAYDDLWSIEYFGTKLRPYWRRNGADAAALLLAAAKDYEELTRRCEAFDRELMADLTRVGGEQYAQLCALAYRQAIGAHKLTVSPDGRPMLFSKECFSNGCIATVDVAYPASPVFMLLSNELLKASVTPVFDYAATDRWRHPFAPHDLGRYPRANGQRYGGGERSAKGQMPVEECGNLLIIAAGISQLDGNTDYIKRYWPLIQQWARYLKDKGLDPENQLCTDDFAGHLAHNANLSLKAIMALGAYAKMCEMAGKKDEATEYRRAAEAFAKEWVKLANDGNHFRLAFDKPGTWSMKYNLVWDQLLGLNLFPPEVARKEVAFYKTKLRRFGLPLDNRQTYTKTDWEVWTATLAESREGFDALMEPVYRFVSATPQRVPLTDWYWTQNARRRGFQARPVIGGVFIKMLSDAAAWKKWSSRRAPTARWTPEQAGAWYARQPWLVGFNFLPSTAVNTTQMWQADTFDPKTIDRELGWAAGAGYNSCRVFLQYIVWKHDAEGIAERFDQFLAIAAKHGISVMPVFFDDCAFSGKEPYLGKQDDPIPGVHNSGWVPSPGLKRVTDRTAWPDLERYVTTLVRRFAHDERIVAWDLYNEPGNSRMGEKSLPLVEAAFAWARRARPTQPLTVGIWNGRLARMNQRILGLSDVVSFHNYGNLRAVTRQIAALKKQGRPLLCTEWMKRGEAATRGSRFATHLPLFKKQKVGAWNWGLVAGKTQTYYPWGSKKGSPEPKLWQHDVFRTDGTPYDPAEIRLLRDLTGAAKGA